MKLIPTSMDEISFYFITYNLVFKNNLLKLERLRIVFPISVIYGKFLVTPMQIGYNTYWCIVNVNSDYERTFL